MQSPTIPCIENREAGSSVPASWLRPQLLGQQPWTSAQLGQLGMFLCGVGTQCAAAPVGLPAVRSAQQDTPGWLSSQAEVASWLVDESLVTLMPPNF